MSGHLRIEAIAAEASKAGDYETRICGKQIVWIEANRLQYSRAEGIDEDVGMAEEGFEKGKTVWGLGLWRTCGELEDHASEGEDSRYGLEDGLDQCGERRHHSQRGEGRRMGLRALLERRLEIMLDGLSVPGAREASSMTRTPVKGGEEVAMQVGAAYMA